MNNIIFIQKVNTRLYVASRLQAMRERYLLYDTAVCLKRITTVKYLR